MSELAASEILETSNHAKKKLKCSVECDKNEVRVMWCDFCYANKIRSSLRLFDALLLIIDSCISADRYGWFSILKDAEISIVTGISLRTARLYIQILKENNLIVVKKLKKQRKLYFTESCLLNLLSGLVISRKRKVDILEDMLYGRIHRYYDDDDDAVSHIGDESIKLEIEETKRPITYEYNGIVGKLIVTDEKNTKVKSL